ncbi:YhgE/Pip domain-containing protein [Liquorilactobacillus hordei DSM 19519]|nr:YhgE/Pip domain-containing protein [Liquorilactobacillus hordei DSM 19519]
MNMIKEEFKNILNHKLLIATILAIMFIPFLYSVFFLKSVWDPYGNAGSLPVAVVNEDKAVSYNGKKMQVGDKLVKELKKNDSLQWHFVSAKKALDGMKHKKYYTIITIPKNFSKNATTVLNKNPKKMRLTYKTNDSLNYIGKVISEEGAKQLNTKINATVTKAYAKTMFATIKQVGTGFTTASKGANKLKEGSTTLSDGLNTYTAGVKKVNDGVIELQTGVVPLSQGVIKLTTGATALQSGVSEYTAGVAKVNTGTQKLNNSTGTLASGVSKLATGSNSLSSGLGTYTSGVSQVNSGLGTLNSKTSSLTSGLTDLNTGLNTLKGNSKQINSNVQKLANDLPYPVSVLNITTTMINNSVQSLNSNGELNNLNDMITFLQSLQSFYKNYGSTLTQLSPLVDNLSSMTTGVKQIQANNQTISDAVNTLETSATLSTSDKAELEKIKAANTNTTNITNSINTSLTSINSSQLEEAVKNFNELIQKANSISQIDLSNVSADSIAGKITQLSELTAAAQKAASGLNNSIGNNSSFNESAVNEKTLKEIAQENATGTQLNTLVAGVTKYTSGVNSASVGSNKLLSALPTLTGAISKLANGTTELNNNSNQLLSGASQLATGLGTLNSNVPTLVSGVSQLASGTSELNSNSAALNSGTAQLASGLTQLNSKVPTLSSGVNQLASGTSQLNANSSELTQGSAKLADGNKALAKALGKGAKKVNAVKTSNKTANMFATPSKLTHKNYSTVPNYGYALAPYMLSVALYVGALVFNLVYPIRRLSTPDGTGTEWFLSKIAVGAVVATGTAVIETLLMMAVGLIPDHPFQMILNALIFSFTAMYLIMFLSVAGGNPGRFAAMILLVIQLGGSGGSFPIDITNGMNGFFQAINPFLPMTYSILGFREALTSGLGSNQVLFSVGIMLIFMIASLLLLWATMVTKRKNGSVSYAEPATEEK